MSLFYFLIYLREGYIDNFEWENNWIIGKIELFENIVINKINFKNVKFLFIFCLKFE